MRLGVLDVGSNTVHLLVVDARRGGHPTPMSSTKASLRLAEAIDSSGKLTRKGADKLISTIDEFSKIATSSGCAELMAFATSAVRDAKKAGKTPDEISTTWKVPDKYAGFTAPPASVKNAAQVIFDETK